VKAAFKPSLRRTGWVLDGLFGGDAVQIRHQRRAVPGTAVLGNLKQFDVSFQT
jgi:hypothetical protein